MDKYNADSIVELIKNVIPKLTRNKAEDISNGLQIKENRNNKITTIKEIQAPRTYETFEGKYSKTIERDIEENQITNIRVDSSAFFQAEEEENNEDDILGIKEFLYNTHSEINNIVTKEEKETAELIQKITKKFNFIQSEKLIENIFEKERKEKESEEITDIEEGNTPLRNLGFNFNKDHTFTIKKISFLKPFSKQSITIKYRVAVQNGKAINQIIIESNLGTAKFGNDGISYEASKKWKKEIRIFKINFPPFPAIHFDVYAGANLDFTVKATNVKKTSLKLTLTGSITVRAQIAAGSEKFVSLAAGVKGTIIKASGSATISSSGISKEYSISGGQIVVYAKGTAKIPFIGNKTFLDKSCVVFDGW